MNRGVRFFQNYGLRVSFCDQNTTSPSVYVGMGRNNAEIWFGPPVQIRGSWIAARRLAEVVRDHWTLVEGFVGCFLDPIVPTILEISDTMRLAERKELTAMFSGVQNVVGVSRGWDDGKEVYTFETPYSFFRISEDGAECGDDTLREIRMAAPPDHPIQDIISQKVLGANE